MAMANTAPLTPALEDYLETIFRLVSEHGFARVRDIAKARQVRSASVSPAMRRLDELGLIRYERREYVALTPSGEVAARKVYARHQLLTRFFQQVLGMSPETADAEACGMEHGMTPEAVDKLAWFFEYLQICPSAGQLISRFQSCSVVNIGMPPCPHSCEAMRTRQQKEKTMSLADMQPGQQGRVTQIGGRGAVRQRLLDMGILPDSEVELARIAPAGDPIWIKLGGFEVALRKEEAADVVVAAE